MCMGPNMIETYTQRLDEYHGELSQFVERLNSGYFIAHTVENVLQDVEGKQMLCEAFFLYGTMLLLLEAF